MLCCCLTPQVRSSPTVPSCGASSPTHARLSCAKGALEHPNLPETHYIDNCIYTSSLIFEEEQPKLFERVWNFVCLACEVATIGQHRKEAQMAGRTPTKIGLINDSINMLDHFVALDTGDRHILMSRKEGNAVHYRLSNPKILQAFDMIRDILFEQLERNQLLLRERP